MLTVSEKEISRRTLAKSGAWAVPVIAAAVASPMAAASGDEPFAVNVQTAWDGNYLDADLRSMVRANLSRIEAVQIEVDVIDLLALWGIYRDQWVEFFPYGSTPFNAESSELHVLKRSFIFGASDGSVPAGSQFRLSYPAGTFNIALLESTLRYGLSGAPIVIGTVTDTGVDLVVASGGLDSQIDLNLAAAWNWGATRDAGDVVMSYVGPTPSGGVTSASISAVVKAAYVRTILEKSQPLGLDTQIITRLNAVLGRLTGAINVQVTPGSRYNPFA